jgi:hypothetical protein
MRTGVFKFRPSEKNLSEEEMKIKRSKVKKAPSIQKETLTLMAVQEKLGLFAKPAEKTQDEKDHNYLKKKPLGLI